MHAFRFYFYNLYSPSYNSVIFYVVILKPCNLLPQDYITMSLDMVICHYQENASGIWIGARRVSPNFPQCSGQHSHNEWSSSKSNIAKTEKSFHIDDSSLASDLSSIILCIVYMGSWRPTCLQFLFGLHFTF